MSTKIFGVQYRVTEFYDGEDGNENIDNVSIVAKDALDAILKVKKIIEKPSSFKDIDTKRKVKVTKRNFTALTVSLRAEADY